MLMLRFKQLDRQNVRFTNICYYRMDFTERNHVCIRPSSLDPYIQITLLITQAVPMAQLDIMDYRLELSYIVSTVAFNVERYINDKTKSMTIINTIVWTAIQRHKT